MFVLSFQITDHNLRHLGWGGGDAREPLDLKEGLSISEHLTSLWCPLHLILQAINPEWALEHLGICFHIKMTE